MRMAVAALTRAPSTGLFGPQRVCRQRRSLRSTLIVQFSDPARLHDDRQVKRISISDYGTIIQREEGKSIHLCGARTSSYQWISPICGVITHWCIESARRGLDVCRTRLWDGQTVGRNLSRGPSTHPGFFTYRPLDESFFPCQTYMLFAIVEKARFDRSTIRSFCLPVEYPVGGESSSMS